MEGGERHRGQSPPRGILSCGTRSWARWDKTNWQGAGEKKKNQPWLFVRFTYLTKQKSYPRPSYSLEGWYLGNFKSPQVIQRLRTSDPRHTENQQALCLLSVRTHQPERLPISSSASPPALSAGTQLSGGDSISDFISLWLFSSGRTTFNW